MDHLDEYGQSEAIHTIDVFNSVPEIVLYGSALEPRSFTFEYFYKFPEVVGWNLKGSELEPKPGARLKTLGELLQAWLFFGLIFTVVRVDGRSLLEVPALLRDGHGEKISTDALREKLNEWAKWAISTGSDIRSRWIKTGLVLQKARAIILKYCSDDGRSWDESEKYTRKHFNENDYKYMEDRVALSLMLLGETLSTIHENILRAAGGGATGWHNYDVPGWGQPRYVLDKMKDTGWCPRNVYLLRHQLGKNATLLLGAYYSHRENSAQVGRHRHKSCDLSACHAKSEKQEDGIKTYVTAHHEADCDEEDQPGCEKSGALGPDLSEVNRILDQDDDGIFPLVKFRYKWDTRTGLKTLEGLDVIQGGKNTTEYMTISHVWSDGYGNERGNELWRCQLEFIRRLLENVEKDRMPFWMDTLLIPVASRKEDEKRRKKKAIRQIYTVFDQSKCTLVLDRGLISMPSGWHDSPCLTALKVLASGWMRRLWTLQEAFLSHKLVVAFEEGQSGGCRDYNEITRNIQTKANEGTSVMAGLIQRELAWSFADDAENEKGPLGTAAQEEMVKIANSWRAARWRVSTHIALFERSVRLNHLSMRQTTSNPAHETLALATLLGVQITKFRSDKVTEAGMEVLAVSTNGNTTKGPIDRRKLHELMVEFWRSVNSFEEGCIPAGIIFVPGKHVDADDFQGFGWAPETFMTPEEVPHPDPLSILRDPTMLRFEQKECHGLVVTCPGFLLHFDDDADHKLRASILSTVSQDRADSFKFPVNNSFNEWYGVNPVPVAGNTNVEATLGRQSQLAIILSRSAPHVSPPERGLLVEIYKPYDSRQPLSPDRNVLFAQILFHVSINRLGSNPSMDEAETWQIFGETMSDRQKWCVDGFRNRRFLGEKAKANEVCAPKSRQGLTSLMLRKFW